MRDMRQHYNNDGMDPDWKPKEQTGAPMTDKIVFTDRYDALHMPHPDQETVCEGPCEGTGFVPINLNSGILDPVYRALALDQHLSRCDRYREAREGACDGWHFVRCQHCQGTGKRHE